MVYNSHSSRDETDECEWGDCSRAPDNKVSFRSIDHSLFYCDQCLPKVKDRFNDITNVKGL